MTDFLRNPQRVRQEVRSYLYGLLLVGPAGTPRTLLGRAVAGEAGVPFLFLSIPLLFEMVRTSGESDRGIFGDARSPRTPHQAEEETSVQRGHRMIHDFFEQGNKATPCVLYIDELEALAHPEMREVYEPWQHQVRMEINGYSNASPAMVVMATVPRREQIEQLPLLQGCFDHEAHYPWNVQLFGGKQGARSLHFLGMVAFTLFVVVHVTLVLVVHFQDNIRNIVLGSSQGSVSKVVILAIIALLVVLAIHVWATLYTRSHLRQMQQVLGRVADPLYTFFLARQSSNQNYTPAQITSYFWINGRPPETEEYKQEVAHTFADYKLEVSGLCARSLHLSLEDMHSLPQQEQITLHNCIQGWSGIAKWTGVPLTEILTLCEPSPQAKYVVFWSYQTGKQEYKEVPEEKQDRFFYEALSLDIVKHPQTILAYAMNDKPLTIEHGAPLRLRCETQLGFKMVKYLRKIELVEEYSHIYDGQGGFREDIQYFAMEAGI